MQPLIDPQQQKTFKRVEIYMTATAENSHERVERLIDELR